MAINKVVCNNETVMDITSSTVTKDTLMQGVTAFDAKGEKITGALIIEFDEVTKWITDPVNNSFVVPNGITTIPGDLFYGCRGIRGLTIPDTLETINYRAFQDCANLKGTVDLKNVKTLGEAAFRGCNQITNVVMNAMEVLDGSAFYYCTALTDITLPGTIKNVKTGAFRNCSALKTVTFEQGDSAAIHIATDAFTNSSAITDIYVYWNSGAVANAPWGAPAGCKIHYNDITVTV